MPDGVRHVTDLAAATEHGGDDRLGAVLGLEHGDVVLRVGRGDRGRGLGAVDEGDADVRGALDDVQRGHDRAVGVDDHARAEAGGIALVGGALGLDLDERGQDLLVGDGDGAGADWRFSIAFLTTPDAIVLTCAWSSGGGDESRVAA